MKLQSRFAAPLVALAAFLSLAACDDPAGSQFDPNMTVDSVVIAAPGAEETLGTAFDVKVIGFGMGGARFPERAEHFDRWDIAVRERDGVLQFVPAGGLGLSSNAAITEPIVGIGFHELREAPRTGFIRDAGVPVQEGALYVVRSREGGGFDACVQYSKVEVVSVEGDPVRIRLRLATNANCYDTRLPTSP